MYGRRGRNSAWELVDNDGAFVVGLRQQENVRWGWLQLHIATVERIFELVSHLVTSSVQVQLAMCQPNIPKVVMSYRY